MEFVEVVAVALVVLASAVYSLWRLTSARFHLRAIESLGTLLGNPLWLTTLRQNTLNKLPGGCDSCGSNVTRKVRPLR